MEIRTQYRDAFDISGFCVETSLKTCGEEIGKLWREFEIKKKHLFDFCGTRDDFYGLMWVTQNSRYCYLIGIETPSGFQRERVITQRLPSAIYAVASVSSDVTAVDAWTEFYGRALPDAGLIPAPGHLFDFEYYSRSGRSDYELWTPAVRKQALSV